MKQHTTRKLFKNLQHTWYVIEEVNGHNSREIMPAARSPDRLPDLGPLQLSTWPSTLSLTLSLIPLSCLSCGSSTQYGWRPPAQAKVTSSRRIERAQKPRNKTPV